MESIHNNNNNNNNKGIKTMKKQAFNKAKQAIRLAKLKVNEDIRLIKEAEEKLEELEQLIPESSDDLLSKKSLPGKRGPKGPRGPRGPKGPSKKGIKILDNEGELVVPLTNVHSKAELQARLDKEDQSLMDVLYDTPYFADVIGDSDYGTTEQDMAGVEKSSPQTYEEWIKGCLDWALKAPQP